MGARILVIEDNPTNLELISYLLTAFGHEVETASDGLSGIEKARLLLPDLIICDIQMPDVSGYEVAQRLKSDPTLAAVPLVAVTALAMVDDRRKVLSGGFDGYITKPIEPETFIDRLAPFLPAGPAVASNPVAKPVEAVDRMPPPAAGARLILVVDNSPDNIGLARSLLEPSGYRVETARNIDVALTLARDLSPSLIVSDLHMPGGSGFEFLRALKADPKTRSIPCMLLSATVWGQRDRDRALELGADRFLFRPTAPEELLDEIRAVLGGKA